MKIRSKILIVILLVASLFTLSLFISQSMDSIVKDLQFKKEIFLQAKNIQTELEKFKRKRFDYPGEAEFESIRVLEKWNSVFKYKKIDNGEYSLTYSLKNYWYEKNNELDFSLSSSNLLNMSEEDIDRKFAYK